MHSYPPSSRQCLFTQLLTLRSHRCAPLAHSSISIGCDKHYCILIYYLPIQELLSLPSIHPIAQEQVYEPIEFVHV